jgi:hypothetical protein
LKQEHSIHNKIVLPSPKVMAMVKHHASVWQTIHSQYPNDATRQELIDQIFPSSVPSETENSKKATPPPPRRSIN